jgi:hypothetical protein
MTLCAGAVADRCQHRADECPPAKNPNATIGRTLRTSTKREGEQGHEGSGKAETMVGGQPPPKRPRGSMSYERSEPGSKCHGTEELTVLH